MDKPSSSSLPTYAPSKDNTVFVQNKKKGKKVRSSRMPVALGPKPQTVVCPSCHATTVTDLRYEASESTHIMVCILCLICWPIACLPYCMNSCQSANHYCPHCNFLIGTYNGD